MAKLGTSDYTRAGADAADFAAQPTTAIPPMPGAAWVEERTRVAVARNINVSGRLVFQEPVRIEGSLRGDITDSRLVVLGPRARVFGRIEADSLRVCEGALLEGDVRVPCGGAAAR